MVDNPPIDLFRYPRVKAAISRFEVKDGDLATLGGDAGQAAVRIAIDQHGFRPLVFQEPVDFEQGVGDRLDRACPRRLQEVVRPANPKILEEDLVQLVVEVLTGMDKLVVEAFVQHRHHPAHFDELGARADHGHDLAHQTPSETMSRERSSCLT